MALAAAIAELLCYEQRATQVGKTHHQVATNILYEAGSLIVFKGYVVSCQSEIIRTLKNY